MHISGMVGVVAVLLTTVLVRINISGACYIHGTDSGECSLNTLSESWRRENMPFCASAVQYAACLPKAQFIPPSINFPEGRWNDFTVLAKDNWIGQHVTAYISYREGLEKNKTLYRSGVDEYGVPGHIARRFYKRPDCRSAYRNYVCWINFPRCDLDSSMALPTCRSSCENFFKSCHYARDLWRCGQSKYFNGYFPEAPSFITSNKNLTYLREYFPGQPFRENKYDKNGHEVPICTPAITGASGSTIPSIALSLAAFLIAVISSVTIT